METAWEASYGNLWRLLSSRKLRKKDLQTMARLSPAVIAKLGRNETVHLGTLIKICSALRCEISDVVEIRPRGNKHMANFTKNAIRSTFIHLLEEKPLNQITIKMIVEECGINRNSFYYHYQDLPALIEDIMQDNADKIINENPTIDSLETAAHAAVDFASSNRKAILHIYNSVNREIFERYLWQICDYVVRSYGNTILKSKNITESDLELLTLFYKSECFGIVLAWLNAKMEPDAHAQIQRFCFLHHGLIDEMIERSVIQKSN